MGKIYHRLFTIQQQLKKKKRNGVVTGSLADKAIDILNEYWDKVHGPAMTVGYTLDPEFIDVQQQSLEHFHDDCDQVGIDILGSKEQAEAAKREWLQIYKPVKSGTLAEGSEGEKNAKQMLAHDWWRLYMIAHCPTLAKLAVNLLAMSVAASPCEGIWSIFDYMIKDKPHFCLKPENLMLQVFVHVNNKVEWKRKEGLWNSQTTTCMRTRG